MTHLEKLRRLASKELDRGNIVAYDDLLKKIETLQAAARGRGWSAPASLDLRARHGYR